MQGGSDPIKFGPYGNTNGTFWDGKGQSDIVQIFISHNIWINSIQYQYVENGKLLLSKFYGTFYEHHKFDTVTLNYPDEYITSIRGYTTTHCWLSSISFDTNLGEYGPFGKFGEYDEEFSVNVGKNRQFFGFHGNVDNGSIYSIGVYMKSNMTLDSVKKNWRLNALEMANGLDISKVGPFGPQRGIYWDGKGHSNIVQIFISHQEMIDSFQYQYVENEELMLSGLHGKLYGNKFDVVKLNYPLEYITWIKGYTQQHDKGLCSITFGTNLGEYGPFGKFTAADTEFSIKLGDSRQFFGFHGTTYNSVESIGVYMKPNMTLDLVKKDKM